MINSIRCLLFFILPRSGRRRSGIITDIQGIRIVCKFFTPTLAPLEKRPFLRETDKMVSKR
jgi:ppGpp synthetase/RelA/SpoT-type nucleotidyltranferase